ncbi:MAG TPA: N-acetylmuramoyl-L-alanine amidase [Myxococcota bacterium]|nr:N-acetylmuramoyl-L-alanine amidase [Myxococcota bacterium]
MRVHPGRVMRVHPLLLLAAALALLGVDRPSGLGDVVAVRFWSYADYTRVVVELDRPAEVSGDAQRLPADAAASRPERLFVDLTGVWVGHRYDAGIPVQDGLLQGIRIGQNRRDAIRVVVDLQHYQKHRIVTLSHPDRLVIDVYGPRSEEPPAGGGGGPMRLPSGLRPIQTVVLDPGHGGRDPGAIGVGGVREKDVTLALARALGPRLEARGFKVVMTRDDDRELGLEERSALAEAARGDLFVSLHANSAPRRSVRGIETYYLDENHERHNLTVAARENGVPPGDVNALQREVAKLRVSEVSPLSRHLAELVQQKIVSGMPGLYQPMEDLGAKKGPFYVLFLSSMPAVLVESGFLSNSTEASRLANPRYVEALADQIAEAVVAYRGAGEKVALGVEQ